MNSSNNVYPTGQDTGNQQAGATTGSPMLRGSTVAYGAVSAPTSGGAVPAAHTAGSTFVSVASTPKVNIFIVLNHGKEKNLINDTIYYIIIMIQEQEKILSTKTLLYVKDPLMKTALESLPTIKTPPSAIRAPSLKFDFVDLPGRIRTPRAGKTLPRTAVKTAVTGTGENTLSSGKPEDMETEPEGDNTPNGSEIEQSSDFHGFDSKEYSNRIQDITHFEKKINDITNQVDDIDFKVVKSKAQKRKEKKVEKKVETRQALALLAAIQSAEKQVDGSPQAQGSQTGKPAGSSQQAVASKAGKQTGEKEKGSKRKGEDDGKVEDDQSKIPKMAYNEAVKKHLVVEIRCSDPTRELDQVDFNHLEESLTEVLTQDDEFNFKFNPETDILDCGLCQGVIWYACKNEEMQEFIMDQAKDIPPPEGRLEYTGYDCFGPGYRPFRYILLPSIKKELWREATTFLRQFKRLNPSLNFETPSHYGDGTLRPTHIRISTGCKEKNKENEVNKNGQFQVRLEVDEAVVDKILDNEAREIFVKVGLFSKVRPVGGGLEKMRRERFGVASDREVEVVSGPSANN